MTVPVIASLITCVKAFAAIITVAVADYVATKIKGAGAVTRTQCVAFFGEATAECDKYPERPEAREK